MITYHRGYRSRILKNSSNIQSIGVQYAIVKLNKIRVDCHNKNHIIWRMLITLFWMECFDICDIYR